MTARSVILYEVDINEISKLPELTYVLVYDSQFGFHTLKQTVKDELPKNSKRFKYLLLNPPPLPKISSEYIKDNAKV